MELEPLPYAAWEPTKTTLHLWSQIVGKIALACAPNLNHWWAIRLRPTARGFSTHLLEHAGEYFTLHFDFVDHAFILRTTRLHEPLHVPLYDGLSVAEFYERCFGMLDQAGINVRILARPYGVPMTTPFADDREHASYDATTVRRFWRIATWLVRVMQTFAQGFAGKQSEPELFWHSFDIAMGRYSGRRANRPPSSNPVEREAYSHEVIAFGFWAGDTNVPEPTFYTYTAPEPEALTAQQLEPSGALWVPSGSGHLGALSYESVRTAADPAAALTAFLESGYQAGVRTAGWAPGEYTR